MFITVEIFFGTFALLNLHFNELKASLQKLETLIPYVKLWLREEFEFELVEESADGSLHDQVQQDDDEEVEDDESVHLLAELRL